MRRELKSVSRGFAPEQSAQRADCDDRIPLGRRARERMVTPTGEIWNTVFAQLESFNSLRDMSLAA